MLVEERKSTPTRGAEVFKFSDMWVDDIWAEKPLVCKHHLQQSTRNNNQKASAHKRGTIVSNTYTHSELTPRKISPRRTPWISKCLQPVNPHSRTSMVESTPFGAHTILRKNETSKPPTESSPPKLSATAEHIISTWIYSFVFIPSPLTPPLEHNPPPLADEPRPFHFCVSLACRSAIRRHLGAAMEMISFLLLRLNLQLCSSIFCSLFFS